MLVPPGYWAPKTMGVVTEADNAAFPGLRRVAVVSPPGHTWRKATKAPHARYWWPSAPTGWVPVSSITCETTVARLNRSAGRGRRSSDRGIPQVPIAGVDDRLAREEADLVAQVAAGDIGAPVAELYRRYADRLYRFGLRALGNPGLAEEMVQECFVRLWRTAGRFDAERGSVAAYLFVIARSVASDVRRRPSSRPLVPVEDVQLPPQADSVDRILESVIVREGLDALSPAHQEVLRLVHEEGLTQSQIAQRLRLPLGTVKTRLFHGLRALRAALIERGFDATT
jgi:RNA polymerase sigma-70 factor, ECF subfamily